MNTISYKLLSLIAVLALSVAGTTSAHTKYGSKYAPDDPKGPVYQRFAGVEVYPRMHYYPYDDNYRRVYHYPRKHFVCYRIKKAVNVAPGKYKFFVQCPYQGWYSTAPYYRTYYHKVKHRPQYVCMRRGAHKFKRFLYRNEAVGWWHHNCNRWHFRRTDYIQI